MVSTTLTSVFGEHPEVRVVEFLAQHREFDYTITEISRNAGVSRPASYKTVDRLIAHGVIEKTRRVGASSFYRLNVDHPVVKPFLDANVLEPSSRPVTRRAAPREVSRR